MNDSAAPTREEVLDTVAAYIREVVAEPWIAEIPINLDTSFSQDLELESIEFVALAAKLRERYGHEAEFTDWLAGLEFEEIIGLRVGAVVEFILRCQSSR
jgi:acyl carrier protein